MGAGRTGSLIEHLRSTVLRQDTDRLSDGQLLARFVTRRDQAAFEALVQRHAGMVWGVCRRLLHSTQDAEDAFQASLLVLARKAASVQPRDKLPNWLHGVAHQTAIRTRALVARRRRREKQVPQMPESVTADPSLNEQLRPLLDQELARLPDRYREVVILCDLEGRTRRDVALHLKIPDGTVASRLATARQMLARRLARHGLLVAGGSLAVVLAQQAAAAVPAAMVRDVVISQSAGAVSARIKMIAEGVLKAMLIAKLKNTAMVTLLLGAVTFGGVMTYRSVAAQQGATQSNGGGQNVQSTNRPAPKVIDNDTKLLGEWFVKDDGQGSLSLFFGPGGTIRAVRMNESDERGTYAVDWRKKPAHLDVTWDGATVYRSLLEFIDDSKIRIQSGVPGGARPDGLTPSAIVLTRRELPGNGVREMQAAKDLAIAEYYQKTGHYAVARFHYELVRERYPNGDYAKRATQGLAALEKFRRPRADGSLGWIEPETRARQPEPVTEIQFEARTLGKGGPMVIVLENAKISLPNPDGMRLTCTKTADGDRVRLEVPGIRVEVPHLTIESGGQVMKVETAAGMLVATRDVQPRPAPPAGEYVGSIIIVGNTKTSDEIIREKLQLYPGQALHADTLLLAQRRLAALRATVDLQPVANNPSCKDVVVTVHEK
jgi:RNA polymerase sigma factor (sigma-70 family)